MVGLVEFMIGDVRELQHFLFVFPSGRDTMDSENASYAVSPEKRGLHIGEKLVLHSLQLAKEHGFRMKDGHYEDICPYYCVL